MGVPKQKWTQEEEAALTAGVHKHGPGKWRTILKDPEFSGILYLRSNVDLKDKWRNMGVMSNGWGSREKARLALKRTRPVSKQDDNCLALTEVASNEQPLSTTPLAISSSSSPIGVPKRTTMRLDNLIMEAINNLKSRPGGANKTTIGSFIEEQYWSPPNFKRLLSAKLKSLTSSGKLIKMKRKYRIAPSSGSLEGRTVSNILLEGRQRDSPIAEDDNTRVFTKIPPMDLVLAKMRGMTPEEASLAAAEAVAAAEVAIAEAEEAAREAEEAEADAEAALAFAEAAERTLKGRNGTKADMQMVHS